MVFGNINKNFSLQISEKRGITSFGNSAISFLLLKHLLTQL